MAARATITQLAARKAKLEADLAKVNAEIAARAGETDEARKDA
ncbi:hypothetical protein [Jiangella sp. DSM 45060]|nr:hypothetical protein [Jiangella sp. DSM 45060]SDT69485.1 hypothetical protein SAMN04515669_6028 [Jiangella sp. DSM 45060]